MKFDGERASIDSKIASLERTILELKTRRNELSSISNLPTELLCRIFMEHRSLSGRTKTTPILSWTRITHVCRRWRMVGLECVELWKEIPSTSLDWAQLMLERSKTAPVSLLLAGKYPIGMGAVIIPKAAPRLHELIIQYAKWERPDQPYNDFDKCFAPLSSGPSILDTLAVHNTGGFDDIAQASHIFLPPRLRQLSLYNCFLMPPRQLKEFHFTFHYGQFTMSFDRLIEVIAQMQELEVLRLLPLYCVIDYPTSMCPVARLPDLQSLVLAAPIRRCAQIMSYLALPTSASISLNFSDFRYETIEMVGFGSALCTSWLFRPLERREEDLIPSSVGITFQTLQISSVIAAWSEAVQPFAEDGEVVETPDVSLSTLTHTDHYQLVQHSFPPSSIANLRSLRLDVMVADDFTLRTFVGTLRSLETLALSGKACGQLLPCIEPHLAQEDERVEQDVKVLPSLHHVRLHNPDEATLGDEWVCRVSGSLASRKLLGSPLWSLTLSGHCSTVSSDEVEQFVPHVKSVHRLSMTHPLGL